MWVQREVGLDPRPRGFHLVGGEIFSALPELRELSVGLLHLLIQHTSAALALNGNASPQVRNDFRSWFDRAVPEDAPYGTHTLEAADDTTLASSHGRFQGVAARAVAHPSRGRWTAGARHVAGHLPVRVS